ISRIFRRGKVAFRPVLLSSSMFVVVMVRGGTPGRQAPVATMKPIIDRMFITMSVTPRWDLRASAAALLTLGLLAGCAGSGERFATMITPYRADVVQGNF